MKKLYITLIAGLVLLLTMRCRQHYVLPNSSQNLNILVVEGNINTGTDSSTIRLSRTIKLTDSLNVLPELGAQLSVVDASGNEIAAFTETDSGRYVMPGLNNNALPNTTRLKIVTSNGKTYLSDLLTVKNSQPIDSVGFEIGGNGLQIYSSTHDPSSQSRYYRWDYTEDWIIHSDYQSNLEAHTNPIDTIVARPVEDQIFTCWQHDASSSIIINTSVTLSQDVIAHNPVAFIPSSAEKLGHEYCITLNQYALTKDAFNYWQNLKKNTEQLGSIFDAQPSEIKGNIHNTTDPNEAVIGYMSIGKSAQKRLFIGNSQVPSLWFQLVPNPYPGCVIDSLFFVDPARQNTNSTLLLYPGFEIPIEPIYTPREQLIGYYGARSFCVDCRLRGTTKRPSFWIDKY